MASSSLERWFLNAATIVSLSVLCAYWWTMYIWYAPSSACVWIGVTASTKSISYGAFSTATLLDLLDDLPDFSDLGFGSSTSSPSAPSSGGSSLTSGILILTIALKGGGSGKSWSGGNGFSSTSAGGYCSPSPSFFSSTAAAFGSPSAGFSCSVVGSSGGCGCLKVGTFRLILLIQPSSFLEDSSDVYGFLQ